MQIFFLEVDGEKAAFGAAGIALGSFLPHMFASWRESQATKRKAAADFRAAIQSALAGIYPEPAQWPEDINEFLRRAFPALQNAVELYYPYVPRRCRRAFRRAWFNYRCGTGREIDTQNYFHYMEFDDNPDAKGNFRRNVDSLLRFAGR